MKCSIDFIKMFYRFQLNTSIEHPHGKNVLDVVFQPIAQEKDLKCVTISNDGKFKIWTKDITLTGKKINWNNGKFNQTKLIRLRFT